MSARAWVFVWTVLGATIAVGAERGLVAHYDFEDGAGKVAKDRSGKGNDGKLVGGVKWVKGRFGTALELDGKSGFVDAGAEASLNIASGGTIMLWCRPKTLQGGLVNWSTGGGWNDERLVMAINTYHGGSRPIGVMADGDGSAGFGLGNLREGTWNHVALVFDGKTVQVYNDGLLVSKRAQMITPKIAGVPMWIGKCLGLGQSFFRGMIDEVRVYNRPLSPREIVNHYRKQGARRGKDLEVFDRLVVSAVAAPAPGRILVNVDARAMRFAHEVAKVRLTLSPGKKTAEITGLRETGPSNAVIDVQDLPPGEYTIQAAALNKNNQAVGKGGSAAVKWPGVPEVYKDIKILNNFCWELLNVQRDRGIVDVPTFPLPIDRWVFVRTTAHVADGGQARVVIEGDPLGRPATRHTATGSLEAMRYLKAGRYKLRVETKGDAAVKRIIVRAIPALQHAFYGSVPHINAYGPHDWQRLSKDVLPNVNVMISGAAPKPEHIKPWKQSGRKWISIIDNARRLGSDTTAEAVFKYWSGAMGYQHPLMDGIIVDEFGGGDAPIYDVYRAAVEKLNAAFPGRMYMPYGGRFYGDDRSRGFAKAALAGGGYVCPEHYLREQPSKQEAEQFIYDSLIADMPRWEQGIPGVIPRVIVVLGYLSHPTESLNVNPLVNFRVYMDMQMRALATHPACFGLGGIQWYHASYCDEENVRWAGRLFRHYCIEGKTTPATDEPYLLTHIRNPDFADGTKGWKIVPAEAGSIKTGRHNGYSWLEGRYPRTKMGDTFLLMKRSAKKPNVFSQQIRNLTPGRLYSMKMITADYRDLVQEKSDKKRNAVTIRLDDVEVSADPRKNFQFTFPNCYAHHLGKFDAKHNYWMNYHWRVFRAKAKTASLTVTDWKGRQEPGGPIGQELMFNFIEIQPYFGD